MPQFSWFSWFRRKRSQRPKENTRPLAPPGCSQEKARAAANKVDGQQPDVYHLDSRPHLPNQTQTIQPNLSGQESRPTTHPSSTPTTNALDDEPLTGDFLQSVCAALNRNGIRSLKSAPKIPDPDELTASSDPLLTDREPQLLTIAKEDCIMFEAQNIDPLLQTFKRLVVFEAVLAIATFVVFLVYHTNLLISCILGVPQNWPVILFKLLKKKDNSNDLR